MGMEKYIKEEVERNKSAGRWIIQENSKKNESEIIMNF